MIQWDQVKTEYVTGTGTYRELAEKYGVSYGSLKTHAGIDGWVRDREAFRKETLQKSIDLIGDRQARDLARVDHLADELLNRLQTAIGELSFRVIHHKEKGETEDCKWEKTYEEALPGGAVDRQGLRQLAACLKDLKQVKDIQSDLEKMEQEARISKLQKEGKEDPEIHVTLEGQLSEFGG